MNNIHHHQIIFIQTAIKKMKKKFYTWEECMQLREVKVSRQIYGFQEYS